MEFYRSSVGVLGGFWKGSGCGACVAYDRDLVGSPGFSAV